MRRLRRAMLAGLLVVLAFASQGRAAYTIGHAPPRGGDVCEYNATMVQTGSPSSAHLAPYDGVITSWSTRGFWAAPTFKVVRPGAGGGTYTVLASDGPRVYAGDGNTLETYPVRFPVRQGDSIGAHVSVGYCAYADSGYAYGLDRANRSVGESSGFVGEGSGQRVPVAATLERDRDGDGFGDETQDECPTNAATQGPCPLPTQLGEAFPPFSNTCLAPFTALVVASPGVVSAAPHNGVITSWSHEGGLSHTVSGQIRLKTFRPLGGAEYAVVGQSEPQSAIAMTQSTYAARVPVRQGDRIGVGVSDAQVACGSGPAPTNHVRGFVNEEVPLGSSAVFTIGNSKVDVAAVLEADVDNDGFGDTSQDQCPTDASTQGACATDPPPAGSDACEKARKKLAKAKAKLKHLKKQDAAAKKLKKAKKKVKKAKAAARKAC